MTEKEKIQWLMQPRYKVIADYPGRPLSMPIGHILFLDKFGAGKWWHEYTDLEPIHIDEGSKRFPAILRNLEWWEERTADEMPEYLKDLNDGQLYSVQYRGNKGFIEYKIGLHWFNVSFGSHVIPATKEQYLLKTIQNK